MDATSITADLKLMTAGAGGCATVPTDAASTKKEDNFTVPVQSSPHEVTPMTGLPSGEPMSGTLRGEGASLTQPASGEAGRSAASADQQVAADDAGDKGKDAKGTDAKDSPAGGAESDPSGVVLAVVSSASSATAVSSPTVAGGSGPKEATGEDKAENSKNSVHLRLSATVKDSGEGGSKSSDEALTKPRAHDAGVPLAAAASTSDTAAASSGEPPNDVAAVAVVAAAAAANVRKSVSDADVLIHTSLPAQHSTIDSQVPPSSDTAVTGRLVIGTFTEGVASAIGDAGETESEAANAPAVNKCLSGSLSAGVAVLSEPVPIASKPSDTSTPPASPTTTSKGGRGAGAAAGILDGQCFQGASFRDGAGTAAGAVYRIALANAAISAITGHPPVLPDLAREPPACGLATLRQRALEARNSPVAKPLAVDVAVCSPLPSSEPDEAKVNDPNPVVSSAPQRAAEEVDKGQGHAPSIVIPLLETEAGSEIASKANDENAPTTEALHETANGGMGEVVWAAGRQDDQQPPRSAVVLSKNLLSVPTSCTRRNRTLTVSVSMCELATSLVPSLVESSGSVSTSSPATPCAPSGSAVATTGLATALTGPSSEGAGSASTVFSLSGRPGPTLLGIVTVPSVLSDLVKGCVGDMPALGQPYSSVNPSADQSVQDGMGGSAADKSGRSVPTSSCTTAATPCAHLDPVSDRRTALSPKLLPITAVVTAMQSDSSNLPSPHEPISQNYVDSMSDSASPKVPPTDSTTNRSTELPKSSAVDSMEVDEPAAAIGVGGERPVAGVALQVGAPGNANRARQEGDAGDLSS